MNIARGPVLLAGDYWGTVDYGSGPLRVPSSTDAFFVELDGEGQHRSSTRMGAPGSEYLYLKPSGEGWEC